MVILILGNYQGHLLISWTHGLHSFMLGVRSCTPINLDLSSNFHHNVKRNPIICRTKYPSDHLRLLEDRGCSNSKRCTYIDHRKDWVQYCQCMSIRILALPKIRRAAHARKLVIASWTQFENFHNQRRHGDGNSGTTEIAALGSNICTLCRFAIKHTQTPFNVTKYVRKVFANMQEPLPKNVLQDLMPKKESMRMLR